MALLAWRVLMLRLLFLVVSGSMSFAGQAFAQLSLTERRVKHISVKAMRWHFSSCSL